MIKTENITIRNITWDDNQHLAFIVRSVLAEFNANKPGTVYYDPTTDDLFSLFQAKGAAYFVAEMDGKIVDGAGVFPTPALPNGCCELVKLYLLKSARGMGLGKTLIEECFSAAIKFNYTHMYLESMPELNTALGMYEQLGFEYLKGSLGNSGHFGCDIWMLKKL